MAKHSKIVIEESMAELEGQLRQQPLYLKPRVQMLIFLKMFGPLSSKRLAESLDVSGYKIQMWKTEYRINGLKGLLSDKKKKEENLLRMSFKGIKFLMH